MPDLTAWQIMSEGSGTVVVGVKMSVAPRGQPRKQWGDDDSGAPILHVDMDSFFASVEVLSKPELAGLPVIVGGLSNRGVVTAATYEARAFGVRAGMPIGRARSLCPHGVFLPGRLDVYREHSRRVMEVLSQFSPKFEPISIDEAFLDVSGARRHLGTPVQVAQQIRRRVREETGLPASVGVASVKSVAKIASAHAKPDGLLLIPVNRTTEFLHDLPIGALWGVGKRTEELLQMRGVDTIGDLAGVPLAELGRWLGDLQARQLHALAWGIDERPVAPAPREKSISTERTFSENIVDRERMRQFVLEASHDCARRLRKAGLLAWTVTIKLRDPSFSTVTRSKTLVAPTDVGREIAGQALQLFDAHPMPRGGVRLAGVGTSGLVDSASGVPMLLDEDPRPRATEVVMDEARRKFGAAALGPAALLNTGGRRGEGPGGGDG